jgi:hypothetical protein
MSLREQNANYAPRLSGSTSSAQPGSERSGKPMKRIAIALLFGLIAGGICASLAFSMGILKFTAVTLAFVLLNRFVMGFAIGISGLNLPWAWNGIVIGIVVVVGSIFSFFMFMTLGTAGMPLVNFFVNGLFGLTIEFFTTVVFKLPAAARS